MFSEFLCLGLLKACLYSFFDADQVNIRTRIEGLLDIFLHVDLLKTILRSKHLRRDISTTTKFCLYRADFA
jgi:hypothetical protein